MPTTKKRLPARASETLQAMIREAGPVGAATEALLWLGVGVVGLPLSAAGRREIARLMSNEALAPDVLTALQAVYDRPLLAEVAHATRRGSINGSAGGSISDTTIVTHLSRVPPGSEPAHGRHSPEVGAAPVLNPMPSVQIGDDWQEFDD